MTADPSSPAGTRSIPAMRHVVWDWNGTLLDDLPLVVESVNVLMLEQGLEPITVEDYTTHYTRPVRLFYEQLFGRPIADEEWQHVDEVFHAAYDERVRHDARLMDGALHSLTAVEEAGIGQSLLSMYRHDPLVGLVRRFGLETHFRVVQGVTGAGGGSKVPHLEDHLRRLADEPGGDPSRVLLIGDAIDDAVAASHVGAHCVLLASGSHPRDELEAAGVPVVDTLTQAIEVGGLLG